MAPPGRHAPQLRADHLRLAVAARGESAAERAPPGDPRRRLLRPRSRPLAVGSRDAHRLDDRRQGRLAGAVSRERAARFYEETRPIARAFGVTDRLLPPNLDAFDAYMAERLAPGGGVDARTRLGSCRHDPQSATPRAAGTPATRSARVRLDTVAGHRPSAAGRSRGLLAALGMARTLVADWLVAGWRAWNPLLPAAFRQMPQALAADRRVGQ